MTTPPSSSPPLRSPEQLGEDPGMIVLGIDTSGVVCAGIAVDGKVVASGVIPDTRAHAEQLMPLVQRVVAEAGLTLAEVNQIAVGVGPGPFTGLRVGVVAAITLGEALGVPVRGVCSLDVLAAQFVIGETGDVLAYQADADDPTLTRHSRVGGNLVDPSGDPRLLGDDDGAGREGAFVVATDARRKEWYWATYTVDGDRASGPFVTAPDALPDLPLVGPVGDSPMELDAGVLAAIAGGLPDAGLEPLYLRRPDAEVPTARKSTLLPPRLAPRRVR